MPIPLHTIGPYVRRLRALYVLFRRGIHPWSSQVTQVVCPVGVTTHAVETPNSGESVLSFHVSCNYYRTKRLAIDHFVESRNPSEGEILAFFDKVLIGLPLAARNKCGLRFVQSQHLPGGKRSAIDPDIINGCYRKKAYRGWSSIGCTDKGVHIQDGSRTRI